MERIFKYEFKIENSFQIEMPMHAKILSIQVQKGVPCIWAMVDDKRQFERRSFVVYGTGHKIDDRYINKYIGTFQLLEGGFVGHLFEI